MELTFISYNGKYPNLCSGQLILAIDGIPIIFPSHCLSSGGSILFDDDWSEHIESGLWTITEYPEDFPEFLKDKAVDLVNQNVYQGCCGGCV